MIKHHGYELTINNIGELIWKKGDKELLIHREPPEIFLYGNLSAPHIYKLQLDAMLTGTEKFDNKLDEWIDS